MNFKSLFAALGVLILAFQQGLDAGQAQTPPIQAKPSTIAGQISRAVTGEPIAKALVTLMPVNANPGNPAPAGTLSLQALERSGIERTLRRQTVSTGPDGRYIFENLSSGQYRVIVERDGFVRQEFGQRTWNGPGTMIAVAPGQSLADIHFQLLPAGTIAGRVVDENGDPLAGIQVRALSRVYQNGIPSLQQSRQVQTDDRGEYRLYWLTPGEYFISALPNSRIERVVESALSGPEDISYAAVYFPGGIDPDAAVPVRLNVAAEVGGINFVLEPTPTVRVRGRVVSPAIAAPPPQQGQSRGRGGRNNGRVQVSLNRERAAGGGFGRGVSGSQFRSNANDEGVFEIEEVIPGNYLVTAVQRMGDQVFSARTRVNVGHGGIENLDLLLEPGESVAGRISVEAGAPQNFRMDRVRVSLSPVEDFQIGNANARVQEDGSFVLENVAAMPYRVSVSGIPSGGYLAAGRYGTADALSRALEIVNQGLPLQLQIGFSPGRIDGVVADAVDKPYPGVTCVLVPANRNRGDLYKTASTDQYGRFSFSNVAPGDYKVFAWEDVPQGAYLDPDFVSGFEDRGRAVQVGRSSAVTTQVRVITAEPL